jgi:hypothetical protein
MAAYRREMFIYLLGTVIVIIITLKSFVVASSTHSPLQPATGALSYMQWFISLRNQRMMRDADLLGALRGVNS